MAGLQADLLNQEFLKNFIPETVYLLPDEALIPVAQPQTTAAASETTPVEAPQPLKEAIAAQSIAQKTTPAIPKLPQPAAVAAPKAFDIVGENRKGVAVLVTVSDEQFSTLPQLDFLQKILNAIGLTATDVAYVNNKTGAIASFEELQQTLEVNYLISFASRIDTDKPHEKFSLYKPVVVGQVPVVFAQSLAIIEKDVEHKKQLWNALKQMFL
ncbi:hypothetical protein [Pontibacter harenae]|uniref:hypothetical protein n=1 Tax=Pontibacter harenae TaxID=2894083 RepID=UPI001E2D2911|nr:hypothetical protein [Pontibacter harenae]MCC9167040.1 hypothetical protein [Pontibacter harenae]